MHGTAKHSLHEIISILSEVTINTVKVSYLSVKTINLLYNTSRSDVRIMLLIMLVSVNQTLLSELFKTNIPFMI